MNKFLKIIGIAVVAFILLVTGMFFWGSSTVEKVTAKATPFIEESIPLVTTWELVNFKHLLTPEGLAGFESEQGRKVAKFLLRIGKLKSFDKPMFVKSTTTSGDGGSIAIFTVQAKFENGDGVLTFTLVPHGSSYLIQGVNLNSDYFLEQ